MFDFGLHLFLFNFFLSHSVDDFVKEIERRFSYSFLHIFEELGFFFTTNNASRSKHEGGPNFVVAVLADFLTERNLMSLFLIINTFDCDLVKSSISVGTNPSGRDEVV